MSSSSAVSAASAAAPRPPERLIKLLLKPIGFAPVLKHRSFNLQASLAVIELQKSLRKKLEKEDPSVRQLPLCLYCGAGFSPSMDQRLGELFDCFKVGDELVIEYAVQEAYG